MPPRISIIVIEYINKFLFDSLKAASISIIFSFSDHAISSIQPSLSVYFVDTDAVDSFADC